MNLALKMATAYFDSIGMKYRVVGNEEKAIETAFTGLDNKDRIKAIVIFDDDNTSCGIRAYEFCKFPGDKKEKMYEVCSKLNSRFRWVKFYVDEDDNTITLSEDAVIQLDSCGEEIHELLSRLVSVGDDAYPIFMKALWA